MPEQLSLAREHAKKTFGRELPHHFCMIEYICSGRARRARTRAGRQRRRGACPGDCRICRTAGGPTSCLQAGGPRYGRNVLDIALRFTAYARLRTAWRTIRQKGQSKPITCSADSWRNGHLARSASCRDTSCSRTRSALVRFSRLPKYLSAMACLLAIIFHVEERAHFVLARDLPS